VFIASGTNKQIIHIIRIEREKQKQKTLTNEFSKHTTKLFHFVAGTNRLFKQS